MSRNRHCGPARIGQHDLDAVVIYPSTTRVAFASLGYLKVHELLRRELRVSDLSYLPPERDDDVVSSRQGLLLGLTTRRPVKGFDIVAFSISYENDYPHVAELLMKAGLIPLASGRTDTFPLVVAGGFTMTMNPLPIADFIDVAVVGEAEPAIGPLLEVIEQAKVKGLSKETLLYKVSQIEGIYVPALGEHPVRRIWSDAANIAPEPVRQVTSHFGDMFLIEVGRGCSRGCLFCAAGNLYRPVRMREPSTVLETLADQNRIGLVGTAVGDHPSLANIMDHLIEEHREVGISSLRADQITRGLAERLVRCGIKTIAIAPEAASDSLRRRISKGISDQQVFEAVRMLSESGISTIKLYFMIGLPGETDTDAEAIVSMVTDLAGVRGKAKLSVAVGPFVPKPHTAFQWAPFADKDTLRRRIRALRKISRLRACSLKTGSIDEAWVEAVLARGDRSLSGPLLEAVEKGFSLRSVLKRSRIPDPCVELDTAKPLPWDFIDSGVSKEGLLEKYLESRTT